MFLRIAIVIVIFSASAGCGRKSISQLRKKHVNVVSSEKIAINTGPAKSSMSLQYLGSGGLLLVNDDVNLFIDPYFSNQTFLNLAHSMILHGRIKSKRTKVDFAKERILRSGILTRQQLVDNTKGVISAHGHYDHLMDFPILFNEWFDKKPNLYLNASGYNSVVNIVDPKKIIVVDNDASNFVCEGRSYDFMTNNGGIIKVYPILAAHNPHIGNVKFFSGSTQVSETDFKPTRYKSTVNNWLEGNTLSFLIDIERNGSIELRMFVQSSSCDYPNGMPPASLLSKKPVDVAFLGVASYQASEQTYPSSFLDTLKPGKVVFIHWEDFFRSYKKSPMTVPATNVVRFFKEVLPEPYRKDYFLPVPGTIIDIKY